MNLYVFYVGRAVQGSHLELHDMRFCVGEDDEACWPALKQQWWGTPESLHLDAWGPLSHVDGYAVKLKQHPADQTQKLFFVHLGGYDPNQFTELHHNSFIVAPDAGTARKQALQATKDWASPHKDALLEVDQVLDLETITGAEGWHIHLEPSDTNPPFAFEARYVPIGKMTATE